MKTILLATPYITSAQYDLGKLIGKALNSLGYNLIYWDFRLHSIPPDCDYDLAIVFKGDKDIHHNLKSPMIMIFPDDPTYGENYLYDVAKQYDKVYTINKVPGFEWLPLGADEDVHRLYHSTKQFDCCFIGTLRSPERLNIIKYISNNLDSFSVFGNGWKKSGIKKINPPYYFRDLTKIISCHKIIVQEHYNLATDTKDIEIPFVGNALLISDNKPEVKEIYPMIPTYDTPKEAVRLIKYYLEHEKERRKLVKEMSIIAQRFSYKNQLRKIV